ncbi:hypothetical protein ACFSLT_28915 [Novosphingobium resinovorum]
MLRLLWGLARVFLAIWTGLQNLPRQAAVALGAASLDAPARPAKLAYAILVVLPIALVVGWTMPQITLVMTPSIEAWALREKPGPIARGDYVLFVFQHPVIGDKPARITKHALCLPGDRLTTIELPRGTGPGHRTPGTSATTGSSHSPCPPRAAGCGSSICAGAA